MDYLLEMATTPRHNHLVSSFFADVYDLFKMKKVYPLQEQCALVYWGKKHSGDEKLVKLDEIEDVELFRNEVIEELDFVQPDFMLFKQNKFVQNRNTLRTAGVPDLVIEVWSKRNTQLEKDLKERIYSSSNACEWWTLNQNDNQVRCRVGKEKRPDQTLKGVLKACNTGLEFDLRHLAV